MIEHVACDEDGQLLTAIFMDYAMPRAANMTKLGFSTSSTASKYNPVGLKVCGEAGTIGALAAIAVTDGLWDLGVRDAHMPFNPHLVRRLMQKAKDTRAAA